MKHLTLPSPTPKHWRDLPQRKSFSLRRALRRVLRFVDGLRLASGDSQRIEAPRPDWKELVK